MNYIKSHPYLIYLVISALIFGVGKTIVLWFLLCAAHLSIKQIIKEYKREMEVKL